jgi:adenylate cyclase
MTELTTPITGGCLCSAVRYEASEPPKSSGYCHCTMCQRWSGAPAWAAVTFPLAAVRITRGAPKVHQSSPKVERGFCSDCGSSLFVRYPDIDEFCVSIGSLDVAANARPQRHVGIESQLPWFVLADDLPRNRSDEEPGTPAYEAAVKSRED